MRALVLFFLALAVLTGCSGEDGPREVVQNLIAALPRAEVVREPGAVDLGTPAARELLVRGWGPDEADGGRRFVWSEGAESEMEIFLAAPRDLPVSFRCVPFLYDGAPPQQVTLLANGQEVAEVPLAAGEKDYAVEIPERSLLAGGNRLTFRYAWARSPAEVSGGGDRRKLAVAWDEIRFGTGVDESARVRAAGDRLAIPFGHRVDLFFRLPEGAALTIGELRSRDGRPGTLAVSVQPEGEEERRVETLEPGEGPATVDLEDLGSGPVRLSLAAVPESGPGRPGSGLVLRAPEILVPALAKAPAPAAASVTRRRANVIVYLVDTLRKDHLGCYGYRKPVSPHVDAFAREATLFRNAVAQSSWTRPSVVSILTGLLPKTHGVHGRRDALSQEAVTLAEALRGAGYRTAAIVTNGNVDRSFGLGQGFESYRLLQHGRDTAENVNARAAEWLDGLPGAPGKPGAPFFLFLHTIEPHTPYQPPPAFRERFAPGVPEELGRVRTLKALNAGQLPVTPARLQDLLSLYDAEIAANDAAFGALVDLLKQRGLWEETIVVFLSDHGEEFHDHGGWEHGRTLHTEMLDVPLLVRLPGAGEGRAVDRLAQHVDILPTLLDALGLPVPAAVEGRSLLPAIAGAGEEPSEDEAAFSWLDVDGFRSASVSTPAWRFIEDRAPRAERSLFARRDDPAERRNLVRERAVRAGYLRSLLRGAESGGARLRAGEGTVDDELRERLRALGYIQ
ncbi:MAG TPA: sulfatase [Thermoanaerobaculia bacterium]|nr:sulfatase [Thermoanaerobaculia bacterium]